MEVDINIDDSVIGVKDNKVYISTNHYMNNISYRVAIPRQMYTDIQNTYLDMKADYCKRYDYFCGHGFITLTVDEDMNAISYNVEMEHG